MLIHSSIKSAGSKARKAIHHHNPRVGNEQKRPENTNNRDPSSCHGIPVEDGGLSHDNDSSTGSLDYPSDASSDLDPDHPDYAFIKSAQLHAQKSKTPDLKYPLIMLINIGRIPTEKATSIF
jgi:hypothetical protein